jgi:hypothetical protein
MITHTDYDGPVNNNIVTEDYKLPEKVEKMSFSYDGGRLSIYINGEEAYQAYFGTRDCCVEIDNN